MARAREVWVDRDGITNPSEQNWVDAAIEVTSTPMAVPEHAAILGYVTASVNPSRVPSRHPGPATCARDGAASATSRAVKPNPFPMLFFLV